MGQEAAADRDARVREREERHEDVARPRMPELLQAVVRRDRRLQAEPRLARELRRRLLPEEPEEVGRPLEVAARGWVRVRQQPHRESGHDRIDSGLEERDPERGPEHRIDEPAMRAQRARDEDRDEAPDRDDEGADDERVRVRRRDHEERDDVVDDDDREHERAESVREARADERQHAERERRVRGHHGPPAVRGATAGVEGEVDQHGRGHPADSGDERQRHAAALAQLAHVELAARFEPDDEEEERHQPVVDPVAQVLGERPVPQAKRERRVPDRVVGRRVDVDPDECGDRSAEQDRSASGLGTQKFPERRLEVPRPGGAAGEQGRLGHEEILRILARASIR